jgi:hypothetical protein
LNGSSSCILIASSSLMIFPSSALTTTTASSYNFDSYREAAEAYEREYILRKLAETDGNIYPHR